MTVDVKKDCLTIVIAIVIAIATAWAAIAAWRAACFAKKAVKTTRDLAEAQLFTKLIEEYSSLEMYNDLCEVFNWYKKGFDWNDKKSFDRKGTGDIFSKASKAPEDKLDKARRHVTHYLLKIRDLKEAKYIKEKFVKKACGAIDTKAIYALFPLECAKIASRNKNTSAKKDFNKLKEKFNELLSLSTKELLDEKFTELDNAYNILLEN